MTISSVQAIVALGSNLGDRGDSIRRAFDFLKAEFALEGSFVASSILETEPVDCPAGSPLFLNAVVLFKTFCSARELLSRCQRYEKEQGRPEIRERNSARVIDLDLIAYGEEQLNEVDLVIPHPRATQRRFVLAPLVEISPELILPNEKKTVTLLLHELKD